jgi:integrase
VGAPAIVKAAGKAAEFAWEEFFQAELANAHTRKNYMHAVRKFLVWSEKGGKSREIPVWHDLEQLLLAYVRAAGITEGPFFRSANGKRRTLTKNAMARIDVCRMTKRRLKAADLPAQFSPHSFRATVTDLLEQNVPLDDGQSYCLL